MITKKEIESYLKSKGIYEKIDSTIIDELIFCEKHLKQIKDEMNKPGFQYLVNVAANGGVSMQKNQIISEYHQFLGNILKISGKLGLSAFDRAKLKIGKEITDDGFND